MHARYKARQRSTNVNAVDEGRSFFNFMLPSEKIEKRTSFESKVLNCSL